MQLDPIAWFDPQGVENAGRKGRLPLGGDLDEHGGSDLLTT
jgi:hypothetical protein